MEVNDVILPQDFCKINSQIACDKIVGGVTLSCVYYTASWYVRKHN